MAVPKCIATVWQLGLYRLASTALTPLVILHLLRRKMSGMECAILPRLGGATGLRTKHSSPMHPPPCTIAGRPNNHERSGRVGPLEFHTGPVAARKPS